MNFFDGFKPRQLDRKQLIRGMHFCFKNAQALVSEAKLLEAKGHKASALSLTLLAIEELGKIP